MKKNNNKGFTLVELIVVLVILAILAAILVPALLGYIDKAREKQITTNAEAAFVAAQAILSEEYGLNHSTTAAVTRAKSATEIKKLTDITETFSITTLSCGSKKTESGYTTQNVETKHQGFVITSFAYKANKKVATWKPISGEWVVTDATN